MLAQAHFLRNGVTHSGLAPPISVSNQENALLICPQANLMEEIPWLGFPLSKGVKVATKISHCHPFMCSDIMCIHILVQPSLPFISRTVSSFYLYYFSSLWEMELHADILMGDDPIERRKLVMWEAGGLPNCFPLVREGKLCPLDHGPFIPVTRRKTK